MPPLVTLARELLIAAEKIDDWLEQHDIPHTSFDNDTLESLPEDLQKLRWDLLDTSHDFRQLVRGPRLSGLDIAFCWTEQAILRVIWKYKLASAVPIHGSATYQEISAISGLHASLVFRTIRAAMAMNIFDESDSGQVRHTAISRLLAIDEGYSNIVGLQVEDIGPTSLKLIEAWRNFRTDSREPNQSPFSLYNGGRSLFTVLAEEPERAHRFDSAMKYSVEDKDFSSYHIVQAFDWATLDTPGSQMIDLGGGFGQISQALAKHTQELTFTVQDLSHVTDQGRKQLPAEFSKRIYFEAHNFLEPQQLRKQPVNVYLISRCLHNWSDHDSSIILRSLIPTLGKTTKILIWDVLLDEYPVKKLSEKFNLQQDLIMATISNGKDRSVKDFKELLEQSDTRFIIESVRRPEGCKLSMIEVSWND